MLTWPPGALMQNFLESFLFLLVFLAAARGVGAALLEKILPDSAFGHAFAGALGLALWTTVGGLLNAAHIALPIVLDLLLFVGVTLSGLSLWQWYRTRRESGAEVKKPIPQNEIIQKFWLPFGVILCVMYLVSSQMPSLSLNLHDDFFAYLPRPIHMLETGSLGGNPFDVLGIDSLGGQAFLQSFFVHRLSLLHVHGFDAIACFLLCLGLLLEMAWRYRSPAGAGIASVLAFILIPAQIVNVSALFSGSLMLLGLVFSTERMGEALVQDDKKTAKANIFVASAFLSSLWALKNSFVPLGVFYVFFFCLRVTLGHPNKKLLLPRLAGWFGLAIVLLSPWLLLQLSRYQAALRLAGSPAPRLGEAGNQRENLVANLTTAFSLEESPWGGRLLAYSSLVVFLLVVALWSWRRINHVEESQRSHLAAGSALGLATVASYLVNLYLFDPLNGIRYSLPLVLPAVAVSILRLPLLIPARPSDPQHEMRVGALISTLTALVLALAFGGAIQERFDRLVRQRTLLSFPVAGTKGYRQYILMSVGAQAAKYVQRVQENFEPGAAVMAWSRTPFLLDHQRNRIYHLNESSIVNPWLADFPLEGDVEAVRSYLRGLGIRYVFFEHDAPGMKTDDEFTGQIDSPHFVLRRLALRNLALRRVLKSLGEHSQALYKTPDTVVFDIEKVVEAKSIEQGGK